MPSCFTRRARSWTPLPKRTTRCLGEAEEERREDGLVRREDGLERREDGLERREDGLE
jgi:hypothetical protein